MLKRNVFVAVLMVIILLIAGCSGGTTVADEEVEKNEGDLKETIEETPEVIEEAEEEPESLFNIGKNSGMVTIDDEIFVSSGDYYQVNMTLIVSGNEGTIIDAGNDIIEGERVKKYIDRKKIEIKNIIITHRHADHTRNIRMFEGEGVNIYDFDNTEDGQIIEMGNHKMVILHTPGHFNDKHLSVELNDNILIAGDILNSSLDPLFVMDFGGNRETWLETLHRLQDRGYELIIPGHGGIVEGTSIIGEHIDRLNE